MCINAYDAIDMQFVIFPANAKHETRQLPCGEFSGVRCTGANDDRCVQFRLGHVCLENRQDLLYTTL